ncbi:MAG: ABC transporter permease [Acidimicrobiia bacterium]|nr:ABC transporter permease [Acidimicrobiia bacterium]
MQVTAIAFIIALGSGTYSGLTSTSEWRRRSYDASYARLRMYDLRVSLAAGSFVDTAALSAVGTELESAGTLRSSAVQLVGPIQVDASQRGRTILVPGRVVGVEPVRNGPTVSTLSITAGRGLRPTDSARPVAVLDEHFGKRRNVGPGDRIRVSGKVGLTVVGRGVSPEHFILLGDAGTFTTEANFALTFVPIGTAGELLGQPGRANALAVRTRPGVSVTQARRALSDAFAAGFPDVGVTITARAADPGYRLLYDDIEGDQRLYNIFAVLILLGAAFAAFNLTTRIVEAQRREIGIGMALGVPSRRLAVRPVLVGMQIAALGAGLGVVVGLGVGSLMIQVLRSYFPLPVWRQDFQLGIFLRGAALGIALPFVATLVPVWRAVRVAPIDAIRTGVVTKRGRGLGWLAKIRLPGRSVTALPVRNVFRQLRRTVMTALGVAASIAVLLGVVGMLDSFRATIDHASKELGRSAPNRLAVTLATFDLETSSAVTTTRASPLIRRSQTELQLPGSVRRAGVKPIDLLVTISDLQSPIWHPTIHERVRGDGVVLTEKAADDLGVRPGDRVLLRLPYREGLTSYRYVEQAVPVIGLSAMPLRSLAWMDRRVGDSLTNLAGITNFVVVEPKAGVRTEEVQRALFGVSGVSSVQLVTDFADSLQKELDRAVGILLIVEGAVLLLALLIAFNAASISADDRARENATMFAFGYPLRSVVAMEIGESLLVGIIGTAVGLLGGWLLLDWLVTELLPTTLPDLQIVTALSGQTLLIAVLLGVLAVALAPLLTVRKLRRMDVPSTLRVVE